MENNSVLEKDILFIVNPHSGKKKNKPIEDKIRTHAPTAGMATTYSIAELENTIAQEIKNYKAFVAVGGDGTVNQLSRLLQGSKKIIGVLPYGSGDGFASEMGYGKSIQKLVEAFKKGEIACLDCLTINNTFFVNLAGIGFDGYTAGLFQKYPTRGFKSYFKATVESIFTFKPFMATIQGGFDSIEGKYTMITVANNKQFGNKAVISPGSLPTDGVYELVLVKPFPWWYYPIFTYKVFTRSLTNSPFVNFISTDQPVIIETDFLHSHVDGDPFLLDNNKVKVDIHPSSVYFVKM